MLALGNFAVGTGSFVFAGLLEGVARDLSVSVGTAGQLISAYAIVYAFGAPVLATVTSDVPRRPLIVSRVVAACGAALFTPTSAAVAASLAPSGRRGKALATVTGGLTIAFAFGIPLGTLVGDRFGWRSAFVLVGVLGAIAVAGIAPFLPNRAGPPPASLGERVGAVRQPVILATLALTAIGLGSGFVVF